MASDVEQPERRGLRISVTSDQALVAQAVQAALLDRGYEAIRLPWPDPTGERGSSMAHGARSRQLAGVPPDVAVLLSDLANTEQLGAALLLLVTLEVPWLVLAGGPSGPTWGALYERGATLVVPADTGLEAMCNHIDDAYARRTSLAPARRRELIRSWRSLTRRRGRMTVRIRSLTGREEEVLQDLYCGLAVRAIALQDGVTESTVRSQVKSILRKLDVNSQIAAVAIYEELQEEQEGNGHAHRAPSPNLAPSTEPDHPSTAKHDRRGG